MKAVTVLCNVLLACFTCFVVATDGVSDNPLYIIFSLLLVLVPAYTVFVLVRTPAAGQAVGSNTRVIATCCNVLLFGATCWALIDQYPHPNEPGFVEFVALALLTPVFSVVTLLRARPVKRIETVRVG